jgi:hypothetical protein
VSSLVSQLQSEQNGMSKLDETRSELASIMASKLMRGEPHLPHTLISRSSSVASMRLPLQEQSGLPQIAREFSPNSRSP